MKSRLAVTVLGAALISACGDTPSGIGQKAMDVLEQQKASFESTENRERFRQFVDSKRWTPEAKAFAMDAMNKMQQLSGVVNPEDVKAGVDSAEMALACAFTLMTDQSQINDLTYQITESATDPIKQVELVEKIARAKVLIATSAIERKNCVVE